MPNKRADDDYIATINAMRQAGYKWKEIGDALGKSIPTVSNLYRRHIRGVDATKLATVDEEDSAEHQQLLLSDALYRLTMSYYDATFD